MKQGGVIVTIAVVVTTGLMSWIGDVVCLPIDPTQQYWLDVRYGGGDVGVCSTDQTIHILHANRSGVVYLKNTNNLILTREWHNSRIALSAH